MSLSVNVKSLVLQVDAGLVSEVVIAIHCYLVRVPTSFCDGAVYVKYSFHRGLLASILFFVCTWAFQQVCPSPVEEKHRKPHNSPGHRGVTKSALARVC